MTEYIEQFWRDATAADVVDVMNGKEVEARFRDDDQSRWGFGRLYGWNDRSEYHWLTQKSIFRFCQVYSPPQYWLDKPEPGEGFRLLAKFPDEAKLPTDEYFYDGKWSEARTYDGVQKCKFWYRRRIEQPKPGPKYAVGQRVKIIGPNKQHSLNWCSELDQYRLLVAVVTKAEEADLQVAGKAWFYTVEGVIPWRFREDFLEPAVEPEPQHYTLQVGDTAETPSGYRIRVVDLFSEQRHYKPKVGDSVETPSGLRLTVTEHGVEVS